jgi:hypothetical protein
MQGGASGEYFHIASGEFSNVSGQDQQVRTTSNVQFRSVKFPATQIPSSNVNTLDDYEEGTWTATFTPGTSGSITLDGSARTGAYIKIGRLVSITGLFYVASVSSPVGTVFISGLPFSTAVGNNEYRAALNVYATGLKTSATTALQAITEDNAKSISLTKFAAGAASALAGDFQAGVIITIGGTYIADA